MNDGALGGPLPGQILLHLDDGAICLDIDSTATARGRFQVHRQDASLLKIEATGEQQVPNVGLDVSLRSGTIAIRHARHEGCECFVGRHHAPGSQIGRRRSSGPMAYVELIHRDVGANPGVGSQARCSAWPKSCEWLAGEVPERLLI